jgi:hypothetical protein
MCARTTICVLILPYVCPPSIPYACPHSTTCVLILLYMFAPTTIYVSAYYCMCPHTAMYVSSPQGVIFFASCVDECVCLSASHTRAAVSDEDLSSYHYICVLILLYMSAHTTVYVWSYYYLCVLILPCMQHTLYAGERRVCGAAPRISYRVVYYIYTTLCPHTTICVLILLYIRFTQVSDEYAVLLLEYICVLIPLYMCPHTHSALYTAYAPRR